ncbi:MAG: SDR family oxidoreductase [Betaproteobacteria bacterium]|nr:SDR family oxidoreductase [Betaproteobacteria bacterium]
MGAGLVRAFPGLGAKVVSLDRDEARGAPLARESNAGFVPVDVAVKASVEQAFKTATAILGGLDVLVHAAGVAPFTPSDDFPVGTWNDVMAVNALGTVLTNQAAFAAMKAGGGAILNFASFAGVTGLPAKAAYAASKGAVLAWTRTVAQEWGAFNVTVNAIAPAIWTLMFDKTRSELSPQALAELDARFARHIPLGGRLGDIDRDFVPALAFYCSAGARFITGQTICIDGGKLMAR